MRLRVHVCVCVAVWVCACASDTLSSIGALLPPALTDNFDDIIKTASAACEDLPQEILFARHFRMSMPAPEIVEFQEDSQRTYRLTSAHEYLETTPSTLVLYVPGWWNTPTDESSSAIVEALLTRHPQVLVLDTRQSFCRGYVSSVTRVNPLANLLYYFIKNLHIGGFNVSSIHIIGFSLGAHVAGMTGKLVKKRLNTKLGRITALDPAKPCFVKTEYKLDKDDAEFVQVIHSSSGILGLEDPIGHADVYVNGVAGKQPECKGKRISIECDHAQAWRLYSASAMDDKSLMGKKCANWDELVQHKCSGNETVLGYSCSSQSKGMFLYKSKDKLKRSKAEPKVFNPLSLLGVWPFEYF